MHAATKNKAANFVTVCISWNEWYCGQGVKTKASERNLKHALEKSQYMIFIFEYHIEPSHRALRVCRIDCVGHYIFYGML